MPPTAREELINKIVELYHNDDIADWVLANYVKKECLVPLLEWREATDITTIIEGAGEAIEKTLQLAKGEK